MLHTRLTANLAVRMRGTLASRRQKNSPNRKELPISTKINGKKYGPVGARIHPSVSLTAPTASPTSGPYTTLPRALT